MSAADYRSGEIVVVTIRAEVAYEPKPGDPNLMLVVGPGPGRERDRFIDIPLDKATVARAVPVDGEPKPGDLWRDRNRKLYAAMVYLEPWQNEREGELWLVPADGMGKRGRWQDVHADPLLGPIELEHRPEETYIAAEHEEPRCPDCDEPLALIASGAVGHASDACDPKNAEPAAAEEPESGELPSHHEKSGRINDRGETVLTCACSRTFTGSTPDVARAALADHATQRAGRP